MKTLVIEREAVKNNIGVIKERAGEAVIYAVLTGDGQGAGLVELARLLREEGIGRFAVSEPAEAAALRRAGFVEEEILMLRPTVDRAELEQLIDLNVVCTVGSADTGMALNGAAEARSTVVEAHIQIDTGMGFGGFLADEPEKILSVYRNLPNVAVSGICTQLHARKKGGEDLAARLGQFHRVVEAIRAAGFETGVVHAAGSYALLHCADARLDGVRAGSALLGRCRRVHGDGLYRVGYGEVGIEETRWLPKGHTVGSARPIVLRRPTRVAVLPIGYADGLSRLLTGKASFYLQGHQVPIIGRICMDMCMIDVSGVPEAKPGDVVTIFGYDDDGTLLPCERIADMLGTINYEIVCDVNKRVPRFFYKDGKQVGILQYIV